MSERLDQIAKVSDNLVATIKELQKELNNERKLFVDFSEVYQRLGIIYGLCCDGEEIKEEDGKNDKAA
jgi:hypothetical protein